MGDSQTDAFGYPLTAAEALRRQQSPRSQGYYLNGRWIRRKPKRTQEPANDNLPAPRPADDRHVPAPTRDGQDAEVPVRQLPVAGKAGGEET